MHVLASGLVGSVIAVGCILFAEDRVMATIYSPLVVSATIVALGMLPQRSRQ